MIEVSSLSAKDVATLQQDSAIRNVLVVDDSRMQRRILSASLQRWGFAVREAASGPEALDICRDHPPDLVMSDWMMPGMDGLEFCREFRANARDSYGYFILLTSKSGKEEIAHGLDAGADDFLTKPVSASELRARIAAGDRILRMERELTEKNRLVKSTLDELQSLYDALDSDLIEAKKLQ
jgi:sigma-B regulation protein RsbU (phosphoserine phosphatase)